MSREKGRIHFLKTTFIGGIVFLVPVVALIMILTEAVELMMLVARPLADFLPVDTVGGVALANILVLVGLVLTCFIAGLAARGAMLRMTVEKLESVVLKKIPGYVLVKGMFSGLSGVQSDQVHPVLARIGTNHRIGLEIDRFDGGRVAVLVSSSPNPFTGPVHIVPEENVRRLEMPIHVYKETIETFCKGAGKYLPGDEEPS